MKWHLLLESFFLLIVLCCTLVLAEDKENTKKLNSEEEGLKSLNRNERQLGLGYPYYRYPYFNDYGPFWRPPPYLPMPLFRGRTGGKRPGNRYNSGGGKYNGRGFDEAGINSDDACDVLCGSRR